MTVTATAIPGVLLLRPARFTDARGFFAETYNRAALGTAGVDIDFVQDNLSLSVKAGTVRGLHFQAPPFAQAKLVGVVTGRALDVAVDLRLGSPTHGRHVAVELSAEGGEQVLVPEGFAHGFCTLEPDTRVAYKVSAPYAPDAEGGVLWRDASLGIDWPVSPDQATLSDRDARWPRFADLDSPFRFGEAAP